MMYCRVSIDHTTHGRVYKKDFDPQHVFGPLVRAFASEMIRQKLIPEGEHYTSIIIPRYEDSLIPNPIAQIDAARAQEPRPTWLNVEFQDGQKSTGEPLTFFTMELRFQKSGLIYRQDLQIITLDYFWQNIQTALLNMGILKDGDLYVPRVAVCDDDEADFSREEIQVRAPQDDDFPLIELVEIEDAAPDLPRKSLADFDVIETKEINRVSSVELTQLDTEHQDELQVFIAQHTFETLQTIARQDVQIEQGGVLVGQIYRHTSGYLVEITGHIVAEGASANAAELRYNFDSWLHQNEYLKKHFPGKQIVGWYHTHLVTIALQPDDNTPEPQTTELFFSDHDCFMHRRFFSDPWYIAMVLGPQGNAAFFRWFGDKISSNRRFYLFKPEP